MTLNFSDMETFSIKIHLWFGVGVHFMCAFLLMLLSNSLAPTARYIQGCLLDIMLIGFYLSMFSDSCLGWNLPGLCSLSMFFLVQENTATLTKRVIKKYLEIVGFLFALFL